MDDDYSVDLRDTPALECVSVSAAGSVLFSEKTAIRKLTLTGSTRKTISSLDAFPLVEELHTDAFARELTTLDFRKCPSLKKLTAYVFFAKEMYLPESLEKLTLDGREISSLQTLDTGAAVGLKVLKVNGCQNLKQPDLSNNKKLTTLVLGCQLADKTDFSQNAALTSVGLYDYAAHAKNAVCSFAGCDCLKSLNIETAAFDRLILPEQSALQTLTLARMDRLKTLELHGHGGLETLELRALSALTDMKLYDLPALKTLSVGGFMHQVKALELSDLSALENLTVGGMSELSRITFPKKSAIRTLDVSNTSLKKIDLSEMKDLKKLLFTANAKISSLDLSKNTKLTTLSISRNAKLKKLDLSKNKELKTLYFSTNKKLKTLELSKNTKLKEIVFYDLNMDTVSLRAQKKLTKLSVQACRFKTLDLSRNTALKQLEISNCDLLPVLDLSNNKKLTMLTVTGNQKLAKVMIGAKPKLQALTYYGNKQRKIELSGVNPKMDPEKLFTDRRVIISGWQGKSE